MTTSPDIQQPKKFKVLLIGDNCTDIYEYGTVDRISPEAPVPIFKLDHKEERPGMAANVLANLKAFGLDVSNKLGPKSIKRRLIDLRSRQHVLRIDDDVKSQSLRFDFEDVINDYDAVVISDYDKGWISYELVEAIRQKYQGVIFIDTKKQDLVRFWGCYVKVNEQEYARRWSVNDLLIVTLGREGSIFKELESQKEFPVNPVEVVDVCGAGDTFLAAMVAEFLNTNSIEAAIEFANRAGSICVQHNGVYTLTTDDIVKIREDIKNAGMM